MKVLLVGASGFLGSAIGEALLSDGHELRAAGRDLSFGRRLLPGAEWVFCDLRRMFDPADWRPLLDGVAVVVNASGALQSGLRDDLELVQDRAIRTLAAAAAAAPAVQIVHISAAGADTAGTNFMRTKARADRAIAAAGVTGTILRPGLVIGRNGFGGSELLRAAAGLPLVRIEPTGSGPIQCVALADLVEAVRRALADRAGSAGSFDLVGAAPHSLAEIIDSHRRWLGLPEPRFAVRMPLVLIKPLSLLADMLGWGGWRSPLRSNALAALAAGVRGNSCQTAALLGREPLSLAETFARIGPAGKADRWHARLSGAYPIALAALFLLWLAGGLVGLVRADAAAALLVEGGVPARTARLLALTGSIADLTVAAGILFRPALRLALGGGALLALLYMFGALFVLPDLWLDPLGPMVKVAPVVALSLVCLAMAEERG